MITFKSTGKTWLAITGLNLSILTTVLLFKPPASTNNFETSKHLQAIQSQLVSLQKSIKTPTDKIEPSTINQNFNKLLILIDQLKANDTHQLNQLLQENRIELVQKLDALHAVIKTLDQKQHPVKYLPVTALPFKILSIDSIQQVSVASVAYNFKTIPLEKGDSLAGWKVLRIDFGQQRLEVENAHKERVVVNLKLQQGKKHA